MKYLEKHDAVVSIMYIYILLSQRIIIYKLSVPERCIMPCSYCRSIRSRIAPVTTSTSTPRAASVPKSIPMLRPKDDISFIKSNKLDKNSNSVNCKTEMAEL